MNVDSVSYETVDDQQLIVCTISVKNIGDVDRDFDPEVFSLEINDDTSVTPLMTVNVKDLFTASTLDPVKNYLE